jgi:peptidoglycan/LPS O-acetylase OafA/YrhL
MTKAEFVPELHALRGLLAAWVVASHLLPEGQTNPLLRLVSHGGLAVDGFILLSGFVITLVLQGRETSYGAFLLRRFFRLFPVLAACVALMLLLGALGVGLNNTDFSLPGETALRTLLVLGMVQGLVPDAVLDCGARSILGPAWSISLEWQFYLVAPALLGFIGGRRVRPGRVLVVAGLAILGGWLAWRSLSFCGTTSFLPMRLGHFLAGILSAFAWLELRRASPQAVRLVAGAALALGCAFAVPQQLPVLLPWIAALYASLAAADPLAQPLRRGLRLAPLQRLGTLSYCLYLAHLPAIQAVLLVLPPVEGDLPRAALRLLLALGLMLLAAMAIHRWVEQPGIALGRRLIAARRPSGLNQAVAG